DRLDDRAVSRFDESIVDLSAEAEGVGAGCERAHRSFLDSDSRTDRPHLEGVRDRHAGKAELLPQELLQDSRAQRRLLVVECWHADVRSHDRAYAGGDRRAEGLECLVQVAAYHRQLEMGVLRRIAVAWKVLGARGYPLTLKALHERRDMTSNEGGLGAERANPDHGVVGIRVDVCDRREVEVDADRGQFVRDR